MDLIKITQSPTVRTLVKALGQEVIIPGEQVKFVDKILSYYK